LIRFRIDVDYPYPSRIRSFLYTGFGIRTSKDYLKNSKIIARMINDSRKEAKAYWFFTPKTVPDQELLKLVDNAKHEAALHVVNDPVKESEALEKIVGRELNYYTIHGTSRLLARIMWGRWKGKAPRIPDGFPLQSFHDYPTIGLDSLCYSHSPKEALRIVEEGVKQGQVIYFHPIWLFQRGTMNHRGPYYEVLRRILD
jgi:hypothetical protein